MPTSKTEFAESFVWQGPLLFWQAITIGIIAIAVTACLLWFEGRRANTRLPWLFLLLRMIVVTLLLWMLLGPASQTLRREITPKSIAIISDVSSSMQTVDPPRADEDLRWSISASSGKGQSIVSADRAALAALTASKRFDAALALLDSGGQSEKLFALITDTQSALARAQLHLTDVASSAGGDFSITALDLSKIVSADISPELQVAAQELNSAKPVLSQNRIATLTAMGPPIQRLARQIDDLAEAVVAGSVLRDAETREAIPVAAAQSRGSKVAGVLTAAEESWLADISNDVRILRYTFNGNVYAVRPHEWTANRQGEGQPAASADPFLSTDLSAVLEKVGEDAADEMLEAAIVLTDGRHNAADQKSVNVAMSALQELPVFSVPIGSSQASADIIVHHVDAPTAVIENDNIVIDAIISTYQCEHEAGVIKLVADGKVIDQKTIEITSDRSDHRISFATKAKNIGRHAFELRFDPLSMESNYGNNAVNCEVEVIADKIRVLLADDSPRWEFRYLLNLFDRDSQIEFDRLLFQPRRYGTGKMTGRTSLPDDVELWSSYRVVILGDLQPDELNAKSQASLSEYVRRHGGTLVVIAGSKSMPHKFSGQPLEGLLPVEPAASPLQEYDGYKLGLTSAGRFENSMQLGEDALDSDHVWREMSEALPVQFLSNFSKPKPSGRVLIRATPNSGNISDEQQELAFLSWQDVGRGRVVYLASPITYQLRLRHGDHYHHRFWGQLIRWAVARDLAAGSTTVKIRTDKPRYENAEPVEVVVQLMELDGSPVRDATVNAAATVDGKVVSTTQLVSDANVTGRYVGSFETLTPGNHEISVSGTDVTRLLQEEEFTGKIELDVVMEPSLSTEISDVRSNRPLLVQIASVTGGQVVYPTVIEDVVRLAELSPHVQEETSHRPLWDRWTFLWIIVGCLTVEWLLRKKVGLT